DPMDSRDVHLGAVAFRSRISVMGKNLGVIALLGLMTALGDRTWAQAPATGMGEKAAKSGIETSALAAERLAEQLRKHPVAPSNKPGALATFILDTESGEVTRIADEVVPGLIYSGYAEWSHDGKRIVFDIATGSNGQQWPRTQLVSIERGEDKP